MTLVKVGKVTNLSEARYCAGMGVDFLSFPVSQIDPKTYQEITAWVTGPKFGIEVESVSHELVEQYNPDFIQTRIENSSLGMGKELFISVSEREWPNKKSTLLYQKEKIRYIELEIDSIGEPMIELIEDITNDFEVFIKPLGLIDLDAILTLPIAGISLDGNTETKPGLKEYPLSEILEKLEVVD